MSGETCTPQCACDPARVKVCRCGYRAPMLRSGRQVIGDLWERELAALDERLEHAPTVCGCDPLALTLVRGTPWAWATGIGWHDPRVSHEAFWPVTR